MMMMSYRCRRRRTNLASIFDASNINLTNKFRYSPNPTTLSRFQFQFQYQYKYISFSSSEAEAGNKPTATTTSISTKICDFLKYKVTSFSDIISKYRKIYYTSAFILNFPVIAGGILTGVVPYKDMIILNLLVTACGIHFASHFETVPYTQRTRFIFMGNKMDKLFSDSHFQIEKQDIEILPENDSQSVRMSLILNDILDAFRKDLLNHQTKKHLDGLNWEIMIATNRPDYSLYTLSGSGKIIINIDVVRHFDKDDEIATMIAHEVAHVVARHFAELSTVKAMKIFRRVTYQLEEMSRYERMLEIEADYIGLMLLASAGYDPRIAPKVCVKIASLDSNDKPSSDPLICHPCGEERASLLNQDMDKALAIYNKVKAGHSIELRKEGGLILTPNKVLPA